MSDRRERGPVRQLVHSIPPLHRFAVRTIQTGKRAATVTHLREGWVNARAALRPKGYPPNKFIVFGQGRSGSSLLLDLVGSHPDVYCEAEIFHRGAHSRLISPWRYLNSRAALSPRPTYGCQLKIYQMTDDQGIEDPHGFMLDLHREGWRIVHLVREDLFRKALSLVVAETRGQYLDRKFHDSGVEPIAVDPDRLVAVMQERRAADEEEVVALEGIPHVRITYEEDLMEPFHHQATSNRVFEYLEIPSAAVDTRYVKTSKTHPQDYILNYGEVFESVRRSNVGNYLPG